MALAWVVATMISNTSWIGSDAEQFDCLVLMVPLEEVISNVCDHLSYIFVLAAMVMQQHFFLAVAQVRLMLELVFFAT